MTLYRNNIHNAGKIQIGIVIEFFLRMTYSTFYFIML